MVEGKALETGNHVAQSEVSQDSTAGEDEPEAFIPLEPLPAPPEDSQEEVEGDLPFHCKPVRQMLAELKTDPEEGLSTAEAEERLALEGTNDLKGSAGPSGLRIFLGNLLNTMNLIIAVAFVFSAVVEDWIEAAVLIVIIITNTGVGFIQEYRSEKTMEALRKLSSPTADLIRDGQVQEIPAVNIVRGDVIILNEGDLVPADIRLIEAVNLEIDEALLTGESRPVKKKTTVIADPICPLGDRKNLGFKNTVVTKGRGVGVAISTGMETEIGKIAKSVQEQNGSSMTSLQKQMRKLTWVLLVIAVLLALVVFAVNKFKFNKEIVLYAIALAIGILPEGLPAVITVTMAIAVKQMAVEKAIVRRLNALEALGEVTNICSDKTGTLTVGKMTLTNIWTALSPYMVTGEGLKPEGSVISGITHHPVPKEKLPQSLYHLALCASLCNTSTLQLLDGIWTCTGDTTEVALLVFATKLGMGKEDLLEKFEFEAEMPFDASLKKMTVVYKQTEGNQRYYLTKGAIEPVLKCCTHYYSPSGEIAPLTEKFANESHKEMELLASKGLRVLALAFRVEHLEKSDDITNLGKSATPPAFSLGERHTIEQELIFVGLVGMYDPPRAESAPAVQQCYRAGITVHMATGDHPHTAAAIAKQIGIIGESNDGLVMEARHFESMTPEEVDALPELPHVLARCSPESKVKLIQALHRRKRFVAMTGDGVNDAPAVKQADIGIAMGLAGSDVTKQASDILLTDDNFSTIVKAVGTGRRVFVNIGKFTLHLLSTNVAEVVALVAGLAFYDLDGSSIFPMTPLQILWLNLVTTSPPSLLLGTEKASKDIMLKPPRSRKEGLFNRELLSDTFFYGIVMGALSLSVFIAVVLYDGSFATSGCNYLYQNPGCDVIFSARGACFATLYLLLLLHAFNCRHTRKSLFRMNYASNLKLVIAVIICAALVPPLLYIPYLNTKIFKHAPLTWEWGLVFGAMGIFIFASEMWKLFKNWIWKTPKNHFAAKAV